MTQEFDHSEILIDGSPHPAAAFTDPRQKWKAHVAYTTNYAKRTTDYLRDAEEELRKILLKRSAIEKTEKPTDEAQQELINVFNPMEENNIEYWRHGVHCCFLTTEEAVGAAVYAMDNIAETLRKAGRKVSFTRQRARRARLETLAAKLGTEERLYNEWALHEKAAMKKACPDFPRLSPKFVVIDSADPSTPPGTITTI